MCQGLLFLNTSIHVFTCIYFRALCFAKVITFIGLIHLVFAWFPQVDVRELPEVYSNQEETDTRVIPYLQFAATLGYKDAVVRTPDTDIFVILLHYDPSIQLKIYLDTWAGKHRQLINVSELSESIIEIIQVKKETSNVWFLFLYYKPYL